MRLPPAARVLIRALFLVTLVFGQTAAAQSPSPAASEFQAPSGESMHDLQAEPAMAEGPAFGNARLDAVQSGKWPAQISGSTGSIQPNRYGPQRNDPSEGIPAHAYSPFDEKRNREHPCPPGGCEYELGHVLVRLDAELTVSESKGATSAEGFSADAGVNGVLAGLDIETLSPVFPGARAPKAGTMVVAPDGTSTPMPDLTRWYRARFRTPPDDIYAAVDELSNTPGIAWAEPDYLRKPVGTTADAGLKVAGSRFQVEPSTFNFQPETFNDPLYAQQWHLAATTVPQAWDWLAGQGLPSGGSRDIIVAVIDTGVDYNHPDLAANMWVNAAEFSGVPGVDDDGNGYKDDIHGADTVTPDGNPMDDHGHGTHVAGIIAAQANNGIGGVGVAYNTQIMALKAAQYSGVLSSSDIAEAIYYAVEKGADVINMSFGGYIRSTVEEDALAVAFGQAVLVAAAGNDGKVNLPCPFGRDMYPAAYNWVLGVMASTNAGGRASFSNSDCIPHDTHEYELMAPGVDVWSTLPLGQYAAWDGTSMATPVVAGIAVLARTRWADKDVYSSRFIMGQIAANAGGGVANALASLTVPPQPELSYLEHWLFDTTAQAAGNDDDGIVDAGETVDLAIVIRNHWGKADPVSVKLEAWAEGAFQADPYVTMLIDTVDYGAVGSFNWDDNGLVYDAEGVITGVQHPFRFSVDPNTPNDHVIPFRLTMTAGNGYDPAAAPLTFISRFYLMVQRGKRVPWIVAEDMTLTKDDFWIVYGDTLVEQGVTLTIAEGAQIQFGGINPSDPYSNPGGPGRLFVEGEVNVLGTQSEPAELFPWPFLPEYEYRVRINPANRIEYARMVNPQFSARVVDHAYSVQEQTNVAGITAHYMARSVFRAFRKYSHSAYVQADYMRTNLIDSSTFTLYTRRIGSGNVFLKGGLSIYDYADSFLGACGTMLYPDQQQPPNAVFEWNGHTYLALQLSSNLEALTMLSVTRNFAEHLGGYLAKVETIEENASLAAQFPTARIGLFDFDLDNAFDWDDGTQPATAFWGTGQPYSAQGYESAVQLMGDGLWYTRDLLAPATDSAYGWIIEVPATISLPDVVAEWNEFATMGRFNGFVKNAFLMPLWDPAKRAWMRVSFEVHDRNLHGYIEDNYWGTTSSALIDLIIDDKLNNWDYGLYHYLPVQEVPSADAYPFVWDVVVSTPSDPDASVVGAELVTFTVKFNRDMDQSIQPLVSFGPDLPFTDFTIHPVEGGWQDARTWVGSFPVGPITGDGYQLMRVSGAVAADDPWLVSGIDTERFRFEIITSGTEAMNLQATGGEGYVDLMWTQDDFDLLAGYNLYRSTSQSGTYTRLNPTIIPSDQKTWRDTNVTPGIPHYYYFTVEKSDMSESGPSNIAEGTPIDTIAPAITHTPVTGATYGMGLSIFADVTDNVVVDAVTLFYRLMGTTTYTSGAMAHTTANRYSATIPAAAVVAPGLEYYIEASDGISTARHGTASTPHPVAVTDKPTVTGVTPNKGPVAGGTAVTLAGSNFQAGATVTFGGAAASNVVVGSSSQITCDTPAHYAAVVDVKVTNPSGGAGTLLNGYTYESNATTLGLPDATGGQGASVEIPVNASNVAGLVAASFTVTFDPAVLTPTGATKGNLTPGWTLSTNTSVSGQIRLSMASGGSSVTGSGVLANLQFDVAGAPASSTALSFSNVLLNDGAIPVETDPGSFQVHQVYSVSGATRFWNSGAGVPGATLTLSGDRVYTGSSDATGAYTVGGAAAGNYTLTASKSDGAGEITAYDASLALQHDSGVAALSGYAFRAADVNKTGAVTSMDAHYILQKSVDLIGLPFPGAGVVWDFDPASRSIMGLSANLAGQDFTSILLGDVSGNWIAGAGAAATSVSSALAETESASLALPEVISAPDVDVTLDLTLGDNTGAVQGIDLALSYDPTVVDFAGATLGDMPGDWALAQNETTAGTIKLALAGSTPVANDRVLVRVTFDAIGEKGEASAVTFVRSDLNEGQVVASTSAGEILIDTPPVLDLAASLEGEPGSDAVTLRWSSAGTDADHYEVWRAFGAPYFTPETGGIRIAPNLPATTLSYTDPDGMAAQPGTAVFYFVRSVDADDRPSPAFNRVGIVTFGLQPGVGQ